MNEELNTQEEVKENDPELQISDEETEYLERCDGDLDPLSLLAYAAVGTFASIGVVTVGKKAWSWAKPKAEGAIDSLKTHREEAKAKRAARKEAKQKAKTDAEVSEENETK
jgi:hypothetical protein